MFKRLMRTTALLLVFCLRSETAEASVLAGPIHRAPASSVAHKRFSEEAFSNRLVNFTQWLKGLKFPKVYQIAHPAMAGSPFSLGFPQGMMMAKRPTKKRRITRRHDESPGEVVISNVDNPSETYTAEAKLPTFHPNYFIAVCVLLLLAALLHFFPDFYHMPQQISGIQPSYPTPPGEYFRFPHIPTWIPNLHITNVFVPFNPKK